MKAPEFDELVGGDLPQEERARLRRAHEALLAAGPPPEPGTALLRPPPRPAGRVLALPRRRFLALAAAAALAAGAAFAGGFLVADDDEKIGFRPAFTLTMEGTSAAPGAFAELVVGEKDAAGNWPIEMDVGGLPDGRYELLLTRGGQPAASCGTFLVHGDTVAYLNAPYRLKLFDGWVVTPVGSDRILLRSGSL